MRVARLTLPQRHQRVDRCRTTRGIETRRQRHNDENCRYRDERRSIESLDSEEERLERARQNRRACQSNGQTGGS